MADEKKTIKPAAALMIDFDTNESLLVAEIDDGDCVHMVNYYLDEGKKRENNED
jgi:hypothetical protein